MTSDIKNEQEDSERLSRMSEHAKAAHQHISNVLVGGISKEQIVEELRHASRELRKIQEFA